MILNIRYRGSGQHKTRYALNRRVNMKSKKICKSFMITALFTLTAVITMNINTAAAESIEINKENFHDLNFRNYILNEFDKDKNKILDSEEMKAVTKIDLMNEELGSVRNLKGIEYFPNLRELYFEPFKMRELDLSANKQLEIIVRGGEDPQPYNDVKKLDLSQNNNLKKVYCSMMGIEELILPKSNQIEELDVTVNDLKALDVTSCLNLTVLLAEENKINKLNVTFNKNLKKLSIGDNKLKMINLSKCKKLEYLECGGNKLTTLKLKTNKNLKYLLCGFNSLKSLDVSTCKQLEELRVEYTKITFLDVSANKKLKTLVVNYNRLKTLDVSKNVNLRVLQCENNKIKKLNLYKNAKLKDYKTDKSVKRVPPKKIFKNKKVKITALKRRGKNKITVDVKKVKDAAGYQICYSTNKKFSNAKKINSNKKSITLTDIDSNKKYYIKVRAYTKNQKGKKVYSKNSETKKI